MTLDPLALLTIILMAAVTYATRAGGPWLLRRLGDVPTGRLAAWLSAIPGAVLVAIVAPNVLAAGPGGLLAALAVALVAARTGAILPAMLTGVAFIFVWRLLT